MTADVLAAAVALIWFGMVVAISFLEAPLKFRAPGVTLPLGLGIGRIVFRALNAVEVLCAVVITAALILAGTWPGGAIALLAAGAILLIQLTAVRPALARRSNRVISGDASGRRSHAHGFYVGFEVVKAVCLVVGALMMLSTA